MRSLRWSILFLVPMLFLLGACGGGDDDDDAQDDNGGPLSTARTGGSSGANVPTIKDGNYQTGKVHIEVTGDKKVTIDADGNAIVTGGFALFTYLNDSATIALSFQPGSKDEPGALSITTADFATAGQWGKDCDVSAQQTGASVKGEFSCDKLDAVEPRSTKSNKIKVKGTFTAEP